MSRRGSSILESPGTALSTSHSADPIRGFRPAEKEADCNSDEQEVRDALRNQGTGDRVRGAGRVFHKIFNLFLNLKTCSRFFFFFSLTSSSEMTELLSNDCSSSTVATCCCWDGAACPLVFLGGTVGTGC